MFSVTLQYNAYSGLFPYRCKFSWMGSHLVKIYSGLLYKVQMWVAIVEYGEPGEGTGSFVP